MIKYNWVKGREGGPNCSLEREKDNPRPDHIVSIDLLDFLGAPALFFLTNYNHHIFKCLKIN